MKRFLFLVIFLCSPHLFAANGGFYLGQTRVVFPSDKKSVSLQVTNSDVQKDWLLRSWVSQYDENNKNTSPFIITPPLYRLDGNNSIQLRINAINTEDLPLDRESAYRINVMAIPPDSNTGPSDEKITATSGNIQFALNSRIKLFYRPASINQPELVDSAWKKLTVSQKGKMIVVNNPTPFYITLSHIKINGIELKNMAQDTMVGPESDWQLQSTENIRTFSYQTINDYGGLTTERTVAM